jgi:hypothetical protein
MEFLTMADNQPYTPKTAVILPVLLNDELRLDYAVKWMEKYNVSIDRLKRSYHEKEGNAEIIEAMLGTQSHDNPAFANLVGDVKAKTDAEIEQEINLENAQTADAVQSNAEKLANEGGILLAEEQGIADQEYQASEVTKKIAAYNDIFRRSSIDAAALLQMHTFGIRGQVMTTQGVQAIGFYEGYDLLTKVAEYDNFNEENDPYGERNMGFLDYQGHSIIWKLDYYANDLTHGSKDPTDLKNTIRVLTVMLASEY